MSTKHNIDEWRVLVAGVGIIGSVFEKTEELARCAALSKYGEEGERNSSVNPGRKREAIYENDDFSVIKR
ncbi:hypothetical protein [Azonexus sp.]|uniref:hypothetical protein n=1 Tax=Azonexus sp. TaxID=1872668 RepID=UPI0028382896|nr:hypothetical protein [Azonexus sp.]MDR1996484.1 hypothetical protein [Azonexus sp.]